MIFIEMKFIIWINNFNIRDIRSLYRYYPIYY